MALLPTSPEWTRQPYPPALPFGVQHKCFDYCEPTPDCELRYLPSPCICTTEGEGFNPLAPRVTQPATQAARIGQAFSFQIVATNMAAGDTYAATNLPAGLTLNTATGLITGTPTGPVRMENVTITATNSEGTGSANLRINVQAALPVTALTYAGQPSFSSAGGTHVLTDAEIVAIGQHTPNATPGAVITVPGVAGFFGYVFAYPASLPAAMQIVMLATGMNMMSGFTVRTVAIAQPFPGGAPVNYRVYSLHDNGPGSAGLGYALTIGT